MNFTLKYYYSAIILFTALALSIKATEQKSKMDTITYPWVEGSFKVDTYYISLL